MDQYQYTCSHLDSLARLQRTVCPRNLAPDDTDLRSSNLLLGAVDVCDALAQVERCGLWVVDALNLDERCVWVGGALAPLVRKVLAPVSIQSVRLSVGVFQGHRRYLFPEIETAERRAFEQRWRGRY